MIRLNGRGLADPLMLPLIVAVLMIIGLAGFGIWAFAGYADHRDNVEQKVAAAVEAAKAAQAQELQAAFNEQSKSPFTSYISAASLGSIKLSYPKTWSAYIEEDETNPSKPLNAYFHPGYVRGVRSGTANALRMEVAGTTYGDTMRRQQPRIDRGALRAEAVRLGESTGTKLTGEIEHGTQGIMVLFPIRDKTLLLWTESMEYQADFENILKGLSFTP